MKGAEYEVVADLSAGTEAADFTGGAGTDGQIHLQQTALVLYSWYGQKDGQDNLVIQPVKVCILRCCWRSTDQSFDNYIPKRPSEDQHGTCSGGFSVCSA